MLCREQIVDLAKHRDELQGSGVQVVIIGPASAEDAAWLERRLNIPFPVLADITGDVFAVLDLSSGDRWQLAGPRVIARAAWALARGAFPGGTRGRNKQLPGLVLVDRGGRIRMRQAAEDAADHLRAKELLRVVEELVAMDQGSLTTT
jgi:alkyl hydroperoxide reductase subunit AhpC